MKTDLATNKEPTVEQVQHLRNSVQTIIDRMQAALDAALAKKQEIMYKRAKERLHDTFAAAQGYENWPELVQQASIKNLHAMVAQLDELLVQQASNAVKMMREIQEASGRET